MKQKNCTGCGPQSIELFHFKDKEKQQFQALCIPCQSAYGKKWYRDHKAQHLANVISRRVRIKDVIEDLVFSHLAKHPCVDCGERDIIVLEFDHVSGDKVKDICRMMAEGHNPESIEIEIGKCAVRCANCHRRKTASTLGHRKTKWKARSDLNRDSSL